MDFKKFIRPGKGASDITPLLSNSTAFHQLVEELTSKFANTQIDKVACIEGRGFILGGAVAYKLGVGLIPIRQRGKLKNETYSATFSDYSKNEKTMEVHTDAIQKGEKILLVDDWVETGETLKAGIRLIQKCRGEIVGIGVFMDDSNEEIKEYLRKYNYVYLEKISAKDLF